MSAPLGLLAFALLLGTVGPRWLARSSWPTRAPGLGILAWQALTSSVFCSLVLAGVVLGVPEMPVSEGLADFFYACSTALKHHYSTPGGALLSAAGGLSAIALVGRLAFLGLRDWTRARKSRAHQHDLVRLVCSQHTDPDVLVLAHATPAVYCLPGRDGQVIVTQGAISALTEGQLRQVLAHERAHLRARHHLAVLASEAIDGTLFGLLGTRTARESITELAEMHADDAADPTRRRDLASAVVLLAGGVHPVGALAASGGSALARVQRLAAPAEPITRRHRTGLSLLVALTLALPVLIAFGPAVSAVLLDYCPIFV